MYPDCGAAPTIPHAHPNSNVSTYPITVGYACEPGYILTGNSTVQCQENGNWSSGQASCNPVGIAFFKLYEHNRNKFSMNTRMLG